MIQQQTELQLYNTHKKDTDLYLIGKRVEPSNIGQQNIDEPLAIVLTEVLSETEPTQTISTLKLKESLDQLFPEQLYEEKVVKKTKDILGNTSVTLSEEQIKNVISEFLFCRVAGLMTTRDKYLKVLHCKNYYMRKLINESAKTTNLC